MPDTMPALVDNQLDRSDSPKLNVSSDMSTASPTSAVEDRGTMSSASSTSVPEHPQFMEAAVATNEGIKAVRLGSTATHATQSTGTSITDPLEKDGGNTTRQTETDRVQLPENNDMSGRMIVQDQLQSRSAFALELRKQAQEKLYSRCCQEEALLEHFANILDPSGDRQPSTSLGGSVETSGPLPLILLSGPSGVGKTSLVKKALRDHVQTTLGGHFITGKFDQLRRPAPYTAFVSAFGEFTNQVIASGEQTVSDMKAAILEAVGDEAIVLTRMIPSLERIVGVEHGSSGEAGSKADDAVQRFVFVFRNFVQAVCSRERPLVLLLDDVQFADACSLDLMSGLVLFRNEGLVLVATCDEKVSPDSYLSSRLRALEDQSHACISHVEVHNLDVSAVQEMVSDVLNMDGRRATQLAEVIICQTEGNPAHVIEFLTWLQESELLHFDSVSQAWDWDVEEIEMTINTRKVGDYLIDKLEQLPKDMKEVLKASACLGAHIDEHLLEYVLGIPVTSILEEAVRRGILLSDDARGGYVFEHDGVQTSAYQLIPETDRELFHLEIGRRMWRQMEPQEVDLYLFTMLSQMRIGRRLINREKERVAIATLCLHAGSKAAKSSTFRTAWIYLDFGVGLLGGKSWRHHYDLTLSVYNAGAEMAMCCGKFERMDELVDQVLANARSLGDKIPAYSTRIYGLGVCEKQLDAIDLGIEVLRGMGEKFPNRLCRAHLMSEVKQARKLLRGKSNEQLLRLPPIGNRGKLACLQILNLVFFNALFARPKLSPFVVLKMMKITLVHGLSVYAASSFANFGMILVGAGFVDPGNRFGELSLRLLDRFEAKEYIPRVYAAFYGCTYSWKKPLKDTLKPLMHAFKVGLQTGDMEAAFLCANLYCLNAYESGVPLDIIEREWSGFQETIISKRHKNMFLMTMPHLRLIHHHMGLTEDPVGADLTGFGEIETLLREKGYEMGVIAVRLSRLVLAYVFHDYDQAEGLLGELDSIWRIPATFKKISILFFGGLVALQCARLGRSVRKNLRHARRVIAEFEKYAVYSPHNCLEKLQLLKAEYASVCKKDDEAYSHYVCAIAMAKDSGFLQSTALACERTALHLYGIGKKADARPFFDQSCQYYQEWGGKAKLEQLQKEMDILYNGSSARLSMVLAGRSISR